MTSSKGERTVKVGPKGQVVVPKEIRDELGIEPGQHVRVDEVDGEVRVRPLIPLDELLGSLAGYGITMEDVEEEKRADRELEERKIQRWLNQS